MKSSLIAWMRKYTTEHRGRDRKSGEIIIGVITGRIHAIERYLQITLPYDEEDDGELELQASLIRYAQDGDNALDVAEALLTTTTTYDIGDVLTTINQILLESGSKWVAVPQEGAKATLEERVDATTTQAYELAISNSAANSAGLLRKAWGHAFGRSPLPSEAYKDAVRAMEAAAWPVVTPNNNAATLGHILGELKANRAKWHTKISEQQASLGVDMVVNAMQLVWEGHTDRHGSANPVAVTQEAAEQAVFTAVMVCNYCARGYLLV